MEDYSSMTPVSLSGGYSSFRSNSPSPRGGIRPIGVQSGFKDAFDRSRDRFLKASGRQSVPYGSTFGNSRIESANDLAARSPFVGVTPYGGYSSEYAKRRKAIADSVASGRIVSNSTIPQGASRKDSSKMYSDLKMKMMSGQRLTPIEQRFFKNYTEKYGK